MEKIIRKPLKKAAKKVIKKHYGLLLVVCLFAAFLGAEFSDALTAFSLVSATPARPEEMVEGAVTSTPTGSISGMINAIIDNREEQYSKEVIETENEDAKNGYVILGFIPVQSRKGILASVANQISSGGIFITLYAGILSLTKSKTATRILFILIALTLSAAFWAFVTNIYRAVAARMFLEARMYDRVPIRRYLFFIKVRRYFHVVLTMFITQLFLILWNLTIVGGLIKSYSYRMVPYIVAENPSIKPREAITLSRRMMRGHKWEAFILDLSFIPWDLLNLVSFGLLGLFFLNPYKWATDAEYFNAVRTQYKTPEHPDSDVLNDRYLYEAAPTEDIEAAYTELIEATAVERKDPYASLNKVRRFFIEWFGIVTVYGDKDSIQHREYQLYKQDKEYLAALVEKRTYPTRLSPCPIKEKFEDRTVLGPNRCYSIVSLIIMFFLIAFVGWLWEVSIHLVKDGVFVNRGTMHGPWLPIYGAGAVMILILLKKLRKIPWLEFLSAIVLCGFVEYFSHYFLWVTKHKEWWDYSGYLFNLNGRICAEGLIVFGLGGIAVVYLLAPAIDNILRKIKFKILLIICCILVPIFIADMIYTKFVPNEGKGITDYKPEASEAETQKQAAIFDNILVIPEI